MKIITDIFNLKDLPTNQADGLIFNHEFLSDIHDGFLNDDEINLFINHCKKHKLKAIANINRIFTEDELATAVELIDKFIALDIDYYIFSDVGIYNYFFKKNLHHKLIYNARTMITNYGDALVWKDLGIHAAFISNEISLDDIITISQVGHGALNVYGYHQIFYSKRNLVSLYFKQRNIETNYKHKELTLTEERRNQKYPITESNYGTYVYSPYKFAIFSELTNLKDLKLIYISSRFIPSADINQILTIYRAAIDAGFTDELFSELTKLDDNIHSGFLYQKTVLRKGEES